MRIILSPAKKMNVNTDDLAPCGFPAFMEQTEEIVQKGVYAKMARGEMVRFMAENRIGSPEEMKGFDRLGYGFRADLSDEKTYIFIKK